MKKSMNATSWPADPMGHPPLLDIKHGTRKPMALTREQSKHTGHKGQKGSQ